VVEQEEGTSRAEEQAEVGEGEGLKADDDSKLDRLERAPGRTWTWLGGAPLSPATRSPRDGKPQPAP